MPFVGHDSSVDQLFDEAVNTLLNTSKIDRSTIVFVHGSPGIGKTRLISEVVSMKSELLDRQRQRFSGDTAKLETLERLLPMSITFNSVTQIHQAEELELYNRFAKFYFSLRLLHIWLTDRVFEEVSLVVISAVRSGKLPVNAISMTSVLTLIKMRSGGCIPYLLVDEVLKLDSIYKTVKEMASVISEIASLQDDSKNKFAVAFTALKIGIFKLDRTDSSFRPIIAVPTGLLSDQQTEFVLNAACGDEIRKFSISLNSPEKVMQVLSLVIGGHMRSCEIVIKVMKVSPANLIHLVIASAVEFNRRYHSLDMRGAAVLCFFGQDVRISDIVQQYSGSVTVADMVARGELMASFVVDSENQKITPRVPLLSLAAWSFEEAKKGGESCGQELGNATSNLINIALASQMSGVSFEAFFIAHMQLMRLVYRDVMDGIVPNPTNVNWRNASLVDVLGKPWLSGNISREILDLRFDMTRPIEWARSKSSNKDLEKHLKDDSRELIVPKYKNFKNVDFFSKMKSNPHPFSGNVTTLIIAHQAKYSYEKSTTKVDCHTMARVMARAVKLVCGYGFDSKYVLTLGQFWRESPVTNKKEVVMANNTMMFGLNELVSKGGSTFSNLIKLSEATSN